MLAFLIQITQKDPVHYQVIALGIFFFNFSTILDIFAYLLPSIKVGIVSCIIYIKTNNLKAQNGHKAVKFCILFQIGFFH